MTALKTGGKLLLALAAVPVGLALLIGIPAGAYELLGFLFGEVELAVFVPGFALYVFGVCVPAGLYCWARKARGLPSGPFRLPGLLWLAGGAALAVALGQLLLATRSAGLFWLCFILAAALPPLIALALAAQRLGYATSWRRLWAGLLSGSLLSTHLTILLTASVTLLAYLLVLPLRELMAAALSSPALEKLFYSPFLVFGLVEIALVAPVVEELTKPLAAFLLARRLRSPAEAFLVGMAGGVGFAILENMLYEASGGAPLWAGIATLRGVGGVLHPLNAGLVAMGWYAVRNGHPGAWGQLLRYYGLAVGIHALWNGGLTVLFSGIGAYFFGAEAWEISVYGLGQPGVVVVYLLVLAIAMWRLLVVVTERLRDPQQPEAAPLLALHLEQPRRLALWAAGSMAVLAALGALYGPLLQRYAEKLLPLG